MLRDGWEESIELKSRFETMDREIRFATQRMKGQSGALIAIQRNAFLHIGYADAVVSAIAYQAQKNKGFQDHGDIERAKREADRAVHRTQGAGLAKDLSNFMGTSNPYLKWLTMFGSFGSNLYARQRRMARIAGGRQALRDDDKGVPIVQRDLAKAFSLWSTTMLIPAVIEAFMRGDDEEDENLFVLAGRSTIAFHAMPVPIAREITEFLVNPKTRAFKGQSAYLRNFDPALNIANQIYQVWYEDDPMDWEKLVRNGVLTAGYAFHLPTAQPEIWLDNFWNFQRLESARDLVWRKPRDRQ